MALDQIEKDWYCTAKHFHSLLEDAKHCRISNFGRPCEDCKYNLVADENLKCDMSAAYERFKVLTVATGIQFSSMCNCDTCRENRLSKAR